MVDTAKGEKQCSIAARTRDKTIGEKADANIKVAPVTHINHAVKELKFITV